MNRHPTLTRTALLVTLLAWHPFLHADDLGEYRQFFAHFLGIENSYDPAVKSLYADTASLKITTLASSGKVKVEYLTGDMFKRFVDAGGLELSRQKGVKSHFTQVALSKTRSGAIVTARRHRLDLCFRDDQYQLTLAKTASGRIQITSESSVVTHRSMCPNAVEKDHSQLMLQVQINIYKSLLPRRFGDIRVDRMTEQNRQMVVSLTNMNPGLEQLQQASERYFTYLVAGRVCAAPFYASYMRAGGELQLKLHSQGGQLLQTANFDQQKCTQLTLYTTAREQESL